MEPHNNRSHPEKAEQLCVQAEDQQLLTAPHCSHWTQNKLVLIPTVESLPLCCDKIKRSGQNKNTAAPQKTLITSQSSVFFCLLVKMTVNLLI